MQLDMKPLVIPERALFDQAAMRRTISSHPNRGEMAESCQRQMKGYRGQKAIEYYLEMLAPTNLILFMTSVYSAPIVISFFKLTPFYYQLQSSYPLK